MSSAFFSSALRTAMSQFGISASNSEAGVSERWVDGVQVSPALSVLHWQRVRKWIFWRWVLCCFALFTLRAEPANAQLSLTLLQRAQADVERIKTLVEQGTLPKSALDQAQERLADAQDEETLSETLYSAARLQDMLPAQGAEMIGAAARRVERQEKLLGERQKLLDMGIISQAELAAVKNELAARRQVADLARDRLRLLDELRQMAAAEQRMEAATMKNAMLRYDGSAAFTLALLPQIQKDFKAHFNRDLPVSAIGQTQVHQSMGLDHRNKVDVALNPEQPEGVWLRSYLENRHLSYLAFRSALAGAATAPHIHIGAGSTRLAFATR